MMQRPIAMTIAGSDSGGGAGVQADLKTFTSLGVFGVSVITGLTAQNTARVTKVLEVPPEFVE
ncbi:MAG: bifunctional hydroxymethylpyrimidine kinase/phosphomethylpyrimidine kinase, partial [Metallosphaera sp.]